MVNQAKEVLSWYNNMKNPVPTWYSKGYYLQYIDGIPFKLKSPFDFSFLSEYGRVFKVFDDQDSGNVSSQIKNHFRPGKVRHPKSFFDKLYVNNGKLKLTTKERKNLLTIIVPNK